MNKDNGNISSDSSEKVILDPFSKVKVSSYTQVDSDHSSNEIRKIVGQEDESERDSSKKSQDLSYRKQNKDVRPPLVGQASSSSSNDSMSFNRRPNDEDNIYEPNPPNHDIQSFLDNGGHVGINYTRGSYIPTSFLLNREEYINHRPPEGSSEEVSVQPLDNIQECPRIRSPSSASSVTSSKPLEWDSGADVGYNQVYSLNTQSIEPSMSTIERMALACGTNLLTRSDPEGTTGPNGKASNMFKAMGKVIPKYKCKLGIPNAESTPLSTGVLTNIPPDGFSEEMISPINCENIDVLHTSSNRVDNNEVVKQDTKLAEIHTGKSISMFKPLESKIPLFPELVNTLPKSPNKGNSKIDQCISRDNNCQLKVGETNTKNICWPTINEIPDLGNDNKYMSYTSDPKNKSSSLEDLPAITNEPLNNNCHANTLPRSQSQTNLYLNEIPSRDLEDKSICPKYSIAFHNLLQFNKSASSSSVATVVQKKGDSPKHVFSQTSYKKESIGVQVGQWYEKDVQKKNDICVSRPTNFTETPHVPKSDLSKNVKKRSNYFNFDSPKECHSPNSEKNIYNNVNLPENCDIKTNECDMIHCKNGIPCLGAHKRVQQTAHIGSKVVTDNYQSDDHKQIRSSAFLYGNTCSNIPLSFDEKAVQGTANYIINNKHISGVGTVESLESSTKSGGGCADKHSSVTGEDRVNSFEYLPGHIYENTEKQAPVDSRGTSSISIHNQTSNNDTPDEHTKSWDSTASTSSNLEKDVQKGVDIISEFIRGSCAHDSELKKKLIRRVVEKLITKNYNEDKIEQIDLKSNVPWVPSQPPNVVERNGRETRRSVTRSKVPCEFSSRSEKSLSTNASSECFIPKPATSNTFLPSKMRDNTCTGQASHSSTSEISVEKKNHGKPPPPPLDIKEQVIRYGLTSKNLSDSSSKPPRSSNWREPVTKIEKLLDERKKNIHNESSNSQSDDVTLVQYLNMERENQIFWIRSEIQHLSNLKELLEKQEEIKRGIKGLKRNTQKVADSDVLKDKNRERNGRETRKSNTTDKTERCRKISSPKTVKKYLPTPNAWLEKSAADSKASTTMSSGVSTEGIEDWTSHHYKNDNDENLRSCMKRKPKKHSCRADRNIMSARDRDSVLYDEPPLHSYRKESNDKTQRKVVSTPFRPKRSTHVDESLYITNEGIAKRNAQTETLDTVGVQTSHSVEQLPVVHPNWFKHTCCRQGEEHMCQCHCTCHCEGKSTLSRKEEVEKQAPVGYYITFEPSPRSRDAPLAKPLDEVRITMPMSEPKVKTSRRLRAGLECRETERIAGRSDSGSDKAEVEMNSGSSDNGDYGRLFCQKPSLQGAKGMLQYYLLCNRPSYVSRAEDRRQCIAQMQYLRELREQSKRRLLSLTDPTDVPPPPPPPLGVRRVFSQQTMRRQTERKYRQLAEVQGRQQDTKRKQGYRTNRLMADIFKKKLQKRVLKGEVNLSNSVSVISSI